MLAFVAKLPAQVPQLISYQGRVGVDGVNFDGSGQFKFAFVNAAGTTTYWSNDGSSTAGSEPGTAIAIPVSKGLYSILLGDATLAHMSIVPATVFTHGDVHLRVWFSDGVNGFQQLTPDRRIAAVGYAMMADSVSDGSITTAKIADGAVTSEKLAAGVVQTANLATGAVGNAQLANSAVTINAGTGLGGGGLVSLGGNVTLSNAGVLSLTGGGGISVDAGTGAITLSSSATSAGTAGAIVARDASGGFTAGTITAALNGNAATATSATSFTGPLTGDVTGTQAATTIADATVTGKVLTGFTPASGTLAASDTLLSAISKLDGNVALKAPLASPTFTGSVTLPAGSATAAPLLLQTGTSLTTPTFGALEFDGTNLFVTNNSASPTRKTVAFTDSTIAATQITDGTITSAKLTSNLTLGGTTSGTFSGNLTGNVTGNVSGSAASFTGSLTGDVTGTQGATVVSTVSGVTSTSLAAGATLANAATHTNTASTLVRRDASGNFSAGTITAALNGNASTATSAPSFTGMLSGDVTGTQGATVISTVSGISASNIAAGATLANNSTAANTASTLVARDASGNFSAGIITGTLNGNATTATTAGSSTSFTGSLTGDVTGTQSATVISSLGGLTAANVAAGATLSNNATSVNTASTLVKRDASGNFTAGTITGNLAGNAATAMNATNFTGMLAGDVTGTQGATVVSTVGTSTAANINAAELAANAATSANTPGTIMKRDANGDFSAGTITASTFMGKGALPWVVVSGTSQQAEPNMGYVAANAAEVTITLPASPAVGDIVRISGAGTGGWKIAQNAGQFIAASLIVEPGTTWVTREYSRNWSSVASSADGTKLVAGVYDGQIYTSTNSGATWTPRATNKAWKSVASSSDGTKLVAVVFNGQIHTSTDSGATWTPRDAVRNWSCVASSADGTKLVAAVQGGKIYRTIDSGLTWSIAFVTDAQWNAIASSSNGERILASSGSGGYLYRSSNSASSWLGLTGGDLGNNARSWTSVTMSSSGDVMAATTQAGVGGSVWVSTDAGAYWLERYKPISANGAACSASDSMIIVEDLISRDGGQSWSTRKKPGAYGAITAVTISADSSKIVAVSNSGEVHTSNTETTAGSTGYLRGGASASLELQHIGSGRFLPLSSVGTLYPY